MKEENIYLVIGVALIIAVLWLTIKFIGFILEHKLLFGVITAAVITGLIYYSRKK